MYKFTTAQQHVAN